jgi:hypothetical protein
MQEDRVNLEETTIYQGDGFVNDEDGYGTFSGSEEESA